ncbi:hypothetical protein VE04_10094 [Pseudogymnoascus sp. 24MN13]|nr:hypothetical protein VE04_10094 [Pseudogymnoascus sp. 24MN13]
MAATSSTEPTALDAYRSCIRATAIVPPTTIESLHRGPGAREIRGEHRRGGPASS